MSEQRCSTAGDATDTPDPATREAAVIFVLRTLHNRFAMVSPSRQLAVDLCKQYDITGLELLKAMEAIVFNA